MSVSQFSLRYSHRKVQPRTTWTFTRDWDTEPTVPFQDVQKQADENQLSFINEDGSENIEDNESTQNNASSDGQSFSDSLQSSTYSQNALSAPGQMPKHPSCDIREESDLQSSMCSSKDIEINMTDFPQSDTKSVKKKNRIRAKDKCPKDKIQTRQSSSDTPVKHKMVEKVHISSQSENITSGMSPTKKRLTPVQQKNLDDDNILSLSNTDMRMIAAMELTPTKKRLTPIQQKNIDNDLISSQSKIYTRKTAAIALTPTKKRLTPIQQKNIDNDKISPQSKIDTRKTAAMALTPTKKRLTPVKQKNKDHFKISPQSKITSRKMSISAPRPVQEMKRKSVYEEQSELMASIPVETPVPRVKSSMSSRTLISPGKNAKKKQHNSRDKTEDVTFKMWVGKDGTRIKRDFTDLDVVMNCVTETLEECKKDFNERTQKHALDKLASYLNSEITMQIERREQLKSQKNNALKAKREVQQLQKEYFAIQEQKDELMEEVENLRCKADKDLKAISKWIYNIQNLIKNDRENVHDGNEESESDKVNGMEQDIIKIV